MSLEVLQNEMQINSSRLEMDEKGLSHISSPDSHIRAILRYLGLITEVVIGDRLKSWDVLSTIKFLENHVRKNEPILDIGCYASEVIVALHNTGYTNLTGADLNPNLEKMPYQDSIHYETVDFMQTSFADASFEAITSISVIEHGFNGKSLLKEMSRILKLGGYFIASFDYWPEKIDTTESKFFGMDWLIFSSGDVKNFVDDAASYGLTPVGELKYNVEEKPIDCAGKQYTFGWLALKKTA